MPRAKKEVPQSQTAVLKEKIKVISINQVLYVLLLVSFFVMGYLLARVQALEGGAGTQTTAQTAQAIPTTDPAAPQGKVDVSNGDFPVLGKSDAKVTVVEFADYQCPFCEQFFSQVENQLKKDYIDTGKVQFYFRNFAFLGQESDWAAEAAYCANEQNAFWQYHDYLYTHQGQENSGTFSKANLEGFASDLGLNTSQFNNCLDTDKYKDKLDADTNAGKTAGVTGTPTIFINGQMLVGAQPYDSYKTIIDQELNK